MWMTPLSSSYSLMILVAPHKLKLHTVCYTPTRMVVQLTRVKILILFHFESDAVIGILTILASAGGFLEKPVFL